MNPLKHKWTTGRAEHDGVMFWINIIIEGSSIIVAKVCASSLKAAYTYADHMILYHNFHT